MEKLEHNRRIKIANLSFALSLILSVAYIAYGAYTHNKTKSPLEYIVIFCVLLGGSLLIRVRVLELMRSKQTLRERVIEDREPLKWYLSPIVILTIMAVFFICGYYIGK